MPQRFLRPGIRTSPRWNAVSHAACRLYIAILTQVDDYGRHDGRNSVLWAECFAVWNEQNPQNAVNPQECAALCQQLTDAQLVLFYDFDGRKYLQLLQWEERARGKSKWPEPPKEPKTVNPLRIPADSCGFLPPQSSPSPLVIAPVIDARATPSGVVESGGTLPENLRTEKFSAAWSNWTEHLDQMRCPMTCMASTKQLGELEKIGPDRAAAAIEFSIRKNYKGIYEEKNGNNSKNNQRPDRATGTLNEGKAALYRGIKSRG